MHGELAQGIKGHLLSTTIRIQVAHNNKKNTSTYSSFCLQEPVKYSQPDYFVNFTKSNRNCQKSWPLNKSLSY